MEGPREPGYYASVTGVRPPDEQPGLPATGEPLRGPVALYGQVHRYGPGHRRFYLLKHFLGLNTDIERVWKGPERRVLPLNGGATWATVHMQVSNICMLEAQKEATRLNALDPGARGRRR